MPGGFKWVGSLSDDPTGKVETYGVAAGHATRLAIGDVVTVTSTSAADGTPQVDAVAAGADVTGVIVAIDPNFATESFTDMGLPASTAGTVKVNTDPRALYEVDVENGPLAIADTNLNANLVANAATQSGGLTISNMTLNATGKATTATLQFRIKRLLVGSDGVLGSRALVQLNESTNIAGATGV